MLDVDPSDVAGVIRHLQISDGLIEFSRAALPAAYEPWLDEVAQAAAQVGIQLAVFEARTTVRLVDIEA